MKYGKFYLKLKKIENLLKKIILGHFAYISNTFSFHKKCYLTVFIEEVC